jgi:hypothetical protein
MNRAKPYWLTLAILALALNACGTSVAASPSTQTLLPPPTISPAPTEPPAPVSTSTPAPDRHAHPASARDQRDAGA